VDHEDGTASPGGGGMSTLGGGTPISGDGTPGTGGGTPFRLNLPTRGVAINLFQRRQNRGTGDRSPPAGFRGRALVRVRPQKRKIYMLPPPLFRTPCNTYRRVITYQWSVESGGVKRHVRLSV